MTFLHQDQFSTLDQSLENFFFLTARGVGRLRKYTLPLFIPSCLKRRVRETSLSEPSGRHWALPVA